MRRFSLFLAGLFFSLSLVVSAGETVRVLTFNIRTSDGEIGKPHEWKHRRDQVFDIIRQGDYDFVGLQEAILTQRPDLNQVADLQKALPEYRLFTRSRVPSETEGESTPLMYRADRWEMDEAEHGVFWLSGEPNIPGSNTWKNACPRTVVWGKFYELKEGSRTGRAVLFINTHFDHVNRHACKLASVAVLDFAAKKWKAYGAELPTILTGDLNRREEHEPIRYLLGKPMELDGKTMTPPLKLVDSFRAIHPDEKYVQTFHGFRGEKAEEFQTTAPERYRDINLREFKIDFVLATPTLKPLSSEILRTSKNNLFPSDHYPVNAVFEWKSGQ